MISGFIIEYLFQFYGCYGYIKMAAKIGLNRKKSHVRPKFGGLTGKFT